jgi:hypothetical protein
LRHWEFDGSLFGQYQLAGPGGLKAIALAIVLNSNGRSAVQKVLGLDDLDLLLVR